MAMARSGSGNVVLAKTIPHFTGSHCHGTRRSATATVRVNATWTLEDALQRAAKLEAIF
jgi:hypothetical protein